MPEVVPVAMPMPDMSAAPSAPPSSNAAAGESNGTTQSFSEALSAASSNQTQTQTSQQSQTPATQAESGAQAGTASDAKSKDAAQTDASDAPSQPDLSAAQSILAFAVLGTAALPPALTESPPGGTSPPAQSAGPPGPSATTQAGTIPLVDQTTQTPVLTVDASLMTVGGLKAPQTASETASTTNAAPVDSSSTSGLQFVAEASAQLASPATTPSTDTQDLQAAAPAESGDEPVTVVVAPERRYSTTMIPVAEIRPDITPAAAQPKAADAVAVTASAQTDTTDTAKPDVQGPDATTAKAAMLGGTSSRPAVAPSAGESAVAAAPVEEPASAALPSSLTQDASGRDAQSSAPAQAERETAVPASPRPDGAVVDGTGARPAGQIAATGSGKQAGDPGAAVSGGGKAAGVVAGTTEALGSASSEETGARDSSGSRQRRDDARPATLPTQAPADRPLVVDSAVRPAVASDRQVAAAAPAGAATSAGSLADRVRVVEQVSGRIEAMAVARGPQEATIHLKPDSLGSVQITVVSDQQQVAARIVTDTPATRQIIEAGRDQLRQSLQDRGLALGQFSVDVGSGNPGQAQTYERFDGKQSQWASYAAAAPAAAPPASAAAQPVAILSRARLDYQA